MVFVQCFVTAIINRLVGLFEAVDCLCGGAIARIVAMFIGSFILGLAMAAAADGGGFVLTSSAFAAGDAIPRRYTCDGSDESPPLSWHGVPPGTQSLALVIEDPDAPDPRAPQRVWVHWVVYDIPAGAPGLVESPHGKTLPDGARVGLNDWHRQDYGGPCPPIGRHRYFIRLYALDTRLGALDQPTRAAVAAAMQGHVIATAELLGTYRKRQ
jgi:Raf kinase inhibitor-like YbhB/YbcL family protein